jgi:hypothetical protein
VVLIGARTDVEDFIREVADQGKPVHDPAPLLEHQRGG